MPNLTALQQLLAALPKPAPSLPIPYAPEQPNVPQYGGPSAVVEPPTAPLDTRLAGQYESLAGERPTPPAPPSKLGRILNALAGFGAGVQGQGGEYLARLQEPQRQYERRLEDYNERRGALRLRGQEVALDRQERATRRAQELSDREFQQEFARESRRLNLYDDEQKMKLEHSFAIEQEARRQRWETARELEREQRRREDDARTIAGRLGTGPGAARPEIAKELGRYYANITQELSPAAKNYLNAQARRAELLARGPIGGGAVSRRETLDLQRRQGQAAQGIGALEKLARSAMEVDESKRPPILNQMRGMAQTLQAQFPELLEVGESNGWPYARLRLRGSQPPGQQQQRPQADPLGVLR